MLRFVLVFFLNRLLMLAALLLFMDAYTRHTHHVSASYYFQTMRDAVEGWKELQRALR